MTTSLTTSATRPRIVVIGAGFAGLNFVKHIDKKKYDVLLLDRHNYHSFPPLFYQVASCGLEPASISFPLRREMTKRHMRGARYALGNVTEINMQERTLIAGTRVIPFDHLVIAAGTTNNFFGNDNLTKEVFTLKSTPEALRIRNEVIDAMEHASAVTDIAERRRLLSFVVIGGGPTGVEIAGALGEMKRYIIPREYPELHVDDMTITILEGTDRLLRTMSPQASEHALRYLGDLMVDVRLNTLMDHYENETVYLRDGTHIISPTVIWTAGITGVPFTLTGTDVKQGPGGRFVVDDQYRVEGLDRVYALGDIALHADDTHPRGLPQLAQPAIQQAKHLAEALNTGDFSRPFAYNDKGSMATVGRNRAVADLGKMHLGGFWAWAAWMFVHLVTLLGMRNKTVVLINWMWSYFNYSSSLRLLIHVTRYPLRRRWGERK